jgi:PKD repeat protein
MLRRTSAWSVVGMMVLAYLVVLLPGAAPVSAAQPVSGHTGVVPETVRTNMPRITSGEITDLEYIGNRVFVAGTFTSIRNNASGNTTLYGQAYLASFNLTTGLVDATFRPVFGGGGVTEVEASPDGTKLFVVGRFNTVNGVTKRKVASLNPTTGAPVAGFTAHANGAATSVEATNTTVYIGGQFTTINNVGRVGLAAVNSSTGALRTNFVNNLSGGIGVNGALTVQALVLTPDDSKLIVVHTARQIAGQNRYGVGIVSTQTNTLLPWRSRLWEDNLVFVGGIQRAYAAAVSPDGSYFVVTSGSGGDRPPINDTAIRFNLNGDGADGMEPTWISRLFDSVYSVAVSETAVYLGGHFNFMESPTSPDPWPGLSDVGYGKGQGLGGYGLGDDIVVRDHVGAIDPVNGKAIEWGPGSNSFEGNKAMLVHPRGVITGGDATTQGGQNVGRLAVYDFASVPAPGPNETTIVNPIEGRVEEADVEFVVEGMATAASGVRRVQVEIRERDTKRYLQDDLVTWGAANTINAELAAPNAGATTWRLPLTIAGNHRIQAWARTVAVNGSTDGSKASKKFETFGLSDQTPTTSISTPSSGTVIPTLTFAVTGTAQDDVGVNAVTYTVRDAQNRYLQDDGTTDVTYNSFRGTPDVIGATSATWSYEVTVPYEGEWTMQATAVDTAGQSDLRSSDRTWIVSDTAIAPSVALTTPVSMTPPTANPPLTLAPGGRLTFTGSATDDEGLNFVEIQVRNTTTRENLAADGTWSTDAILGWHRISGVNNLPGTSYNWSWTTPFDLAPGTYTFAVRGEDDLGLTTSTANQGKLTINVQVPGDAYPDGTITPAGTQPPLTSLHLDLAGAASDDKGVSAVRVTLRDADSGRYVQPTGELSAAYALLDTTLVSPGATSTQWTFSVDLPAQGDYAVTAFAFDTAGQQDPSTNTATARYLAYPGDTAPTVTENLLAPADGTVFTDARIFVSGRFEDDQQMAQGQVAVRNAAGQYMSSSGAFTSTTESWRTTFLNSPGSPGSNFSYTTPAIPTGDYTVLVRGVDQHGFVTTPPITRTARVAPPTSNPPVAAFTVACGVGTDPTNVCTFDGRGSTDENAPTLTYAWNYGTGQGTGSGPVPKKTYTAASTYTVTLTVKDEFGLTGTTTRTVTIAEPAGNVAPTPVINPPSCAVLTCNLSAVGTADPNTGDTFTYRWNFGDGTATSTSASPAHAFPAAGTYTLTLTVTDGWGKAATVTRSVTVTG